MELGHTTESGKKALITGQWSLQMKKELCNHVGSTFDHTADSMETEADLGEEDIIGLDDAFNDKLDDAFNDKHSLESIHALDHLEADSIEAEEIILTLTPIKL